MLTIARARCRTWPRLVLILLVGFSARASHAQTRFEWPAAAIDVSRYTSIEWCLAAAERTRDSVVRRGPVWRDTLAAAQQELQPAVQDVARRCAARFSAASEPITNFAPFSRLLLEAGRDADVEALLARRLAVTSATQIREQAAVLDTMVQVALAVQPARVAFAESLLIRRDRLHDTLRIPQFFGYVTLMHAANAVMDTLVFRRATERAAALSALLTTKDRRSNDWEKFGKFFAYEALTELERTPLLDSLRRSTEAYVALQRAAWAKASGESANALQFPIGEPAAAIEGAFWFGRSGTAARPAKGKVSLIFVVDELIDVGGSIRFYCSAFSCREAFATLRRLAQRFPAVEITLLAQTRGYFKDAAPPSPREEAELLRQYALEYHKLPGALAVEQSDFWRLDAPDRRRIDRRTPNEVHYSFGRSWAMSPFLAFLVDQNGIIVEVTRKISFMGGILAAGLTNTDESRLATLIDILLARH